MFRLFALITVCVTSLCVQRELQAQTTYWIPTVEQRDGGKILVYNLRVPEFFVPWLLHTGETDGGKEFTKSAGGKTYTFVKQSFTWDNTPGGSNPTTTGQIRIDDKKDRDSSSQWEFTNELKSNKEFIAALENLAAGDPKRWRHLDLTALKTANQRVPSYEEPMDPLVEHLMTLETLSRETVPGTYFPDVSVPKKLVVCRGHMIAIGNLARRDPQYRKDQGCEWAIDFSGDTTQTDLGMEKIFKHRDAPPYFNDLILNQNLSKAAQFQAEYMASIKAVSHFGPAEYNGVDLSTFGDRAKHFGYRFELEGEGCGFGAITDFPSGWMKSDTHFRPWFNIGFDTKEFGLGIARDADGTWYTCAIGGAGKK